MFNDFQCTQVDSEERIWKDLDIVCWTKAHWYISYFVALPSIVVWGLGIPFFAFLLMFRVRDKLNSLEIKERYGFLFRGYKKEFYYWEIIIMYRKIALIVISVFVV